MLCNNCGARINHGGEFCTECGTPSANKVAQAPMNNQAGEGIRDLAGRAAYNAASGQRFTPLVIVMIAVIAVFGFIICFMMISNQKGQEAATAPLVSAPSPSPEPTPSPEPEIKLSYACEGIVISDELPYGKKYVLRGKITANMIIEEVNVIVLDSGMHKEINVSMGNNSSVFEMSRIDEAILINNLTRGKKTFEIHITYDGGTEKVFSKDFYII